MLKDLYQELLALLGVTLLFLLGYFRQRLRVRLSLWLLKLLSENLRKNPSLKSLSLKLEDEKVKELSLVMVVGKEKELHQELPEKEKILLQEG
tara:strand:+ start:1194 stop:1472 length:279 start_codon:yes stop_codon:yes gene_type:complete